VETRRIRGFRARDIGRVRCHFFRDGGHGFLQSAATMTPKPVADPTMRVRAIGLGLFLGTLLVFGRAIGNDWVNYDDPDYVTKNEYVRGGLTAAGARWAFTSGDVSYWHPLTWLSHMADWSLYGKNPRGHHATSVVWHAFNAVLAFLVLRRLTGAVGASALAAALFAWHPLRVESVAWIAERKDVLSGCFALLTIWSYAAYADRRRARETGAPWRYYLLALGAFAGGLMSKPMLVSLPLVLLVLDYWPLRRWGTGARGDVKPRPEPLSALLVEKVPFVLLAVGVSVVTVIAQQKVGTLSTVLGFDARLANAVVAVVRYLAKFVWPFDLAVLYPHPGHWPAAVVVATALLGLGFSGVAVWQWRRRPWLLAGWLWFLVMLAPVAGLVQVGIQSMADRYTYLPMLGVTVALVWTLREVATALALQRAFAVVAALALAGCVGRTWNQLGVWRNSLTLFEHAAAVTKKNYLAHNNIGTHLFAEGRIDEAIASYRRSLAINPDYVEAVNNLGHALAQQGAMREAVEHYRAALRAKPDLVEAHNNLGNALSDLGKVDEAIEHYEFVLARQPRHVDALNNYGVALAMKGRLADAVERITAALRLNPDSVSAHSNLGNVYAMMGKSDDAIGHYRRALELSPNDARTLNNLGNVLAEKGYVAEAVTRYEQAIKLEPVNPEAHANLGAALAKLGRRDEAVRHLRTALQQKPDYAQAQNWLNALLGPAPAPK
jgi:tetratricopeptide (TPR) repeat protein